MEWQPIKTAPKDNSEILLLTRRGITSARYFPGEWDYNHEEPEFTGPVWSCADDTWQIEIEETPEGDFHGEATYWMPKPPDPPGEPNAIG